MAKIRRKQPLTVLYARRRDFFLKKEQDGWLARTYPLCIGSFPECQGLELGKTIFECSACPLFSKDNCNLESKKQGEVDEMAKQINKSVKKKSPSREERIKELLELEKSGNLRGASLAWLTIYRNQGLAPKKD